MKTHRLFPCLFPVLAVATLLHSGLFAPDLGESVTGTPTAQLISLDESPASASQNADQKTDELTALGVDPAGVSQSNDQFTDLFGSASASPTSSNSNTVPSKVTNEEWATFLNEREEHDANAQATPLSSEEESSSPQGAVGGASAQPSMEDVLRRLEAAEERAKKAEDKTAVLEAQLKQPAVGQPKGLAGLFAAVAENARDKPLSEVSDKNFWKQLSHAVNPDSSYTLGNFVDGEAVSDSHQTQDAEAAPSSASSADLEGLVKGLFGGPSNADKSATDKAADNVLGFFGKL